MAAAIDLQLTANPPYCACAEVELLKLRKRCGRRILDQLEGSGGSRNLERGVQSLAREARRKIFWVAMPTFGHANAIKYSWKAEPRGLSQKKSRTLSDSVVLVNYNFN